MKRHPPLATRFVPPRLSPRLLPREALLQRLHAARHCRLTLLHAPAGYGKSIALAQWRKCLVAEGARVAWLTLATDDDAPHAFCLSLLGSFRHAGLALRWQPAAGADAVTLARDLVGALAGAAGKLYVMLDELEHLRDPATLSVLQALIEARLPDLHVAVATRRECTLALGRLQGGDALHAVGTGELAFGLAETRAFLARRANPACRDDMQALDVAMLLHDRTEGWAAGLELAASDPSLRPAAADADPCPPALRDYIDETVLPDVPAPLLHWAARVSLLRRFDIALAAQVTGDAESEERLKLVRRLGLYVMPAQGGAGAWWRFHPQFGAVLRQHCALGAEDAAALHRRAAASLAQRGLVAEALSHAMLCGDDAPVVDVLHAVAPDLPAVSQLREFLRWLETRQSVGTIDHPLLWLTAAWACVVSARPQEALGWLQRWQASGACDAATVDLHAGLIAATIAVQRDDMPLAATICGTLPDGVKAGPALDHIRTALIARCAHAAGRRAPHVMPARGDTSELALMRNGMAALGAWLEGHAREARRLGTEALAAVEQTHGRRSIAACLCAVPVACALYEQDQPQQARERLAGRFALVRFATPDVLIEAAMCRARLQASGGAIHDALAGLADAESVFRQRGLPRGVAHALAEQARLVLSVQDRRHAARLQDALDALATGHSADLPRDHEIAAVAALSRARVALAIADPGRALVALEACRPHAEACGRARLVACAELLQAVALDELGQPDAARACAASALAAAERLGLNRTFVDEGERVARLLAAVVGDTPEGHAGRFAAAPQAVVTHAAAQADTLPQPSGGVVSADQIDSALGHVLTRREREILALLEQSMTNKHIALVLNLSVDTVKWNMRQIFGKLGVSRRYDAILKARSAAQWVAGSAE